MDEERESTCYEMRVEMVMVAGQSGIGWTKRLHNTCMRQHKVPEEWRTGLFSQYGRGREMWKTQKIPRLHTSKSQHEVAREDPG